MDRILLVTRPKYDDGTEYLAYYASLVIKEAEDKGIVVRDFEGKKANQKEVIKFIEKKNPQFLFINGHGDDEALCGNKDEVIFSVNENCHLLNSKITYARACNAASVLGKKAVENNEGCFIGYQYPFSFWIDNKWSAKPSNDKTARLYLEPSNEVATTIIRGKSCGEAHERSKQMMAQNMKKILKMEEKKEPGAMGMLQILWNNYEGQVLHGKANSYME